MLGCSPVQMSSLMKLQMDKPVHTNPSGHKENLSLSGTPVTAASTAPAKAPWTLRTPLLPERHTSRVLDPSLCWGLSCASPWFPSLENKGDETLKALLIVKRAPQTPTSARTRTQGAPVRVRVRGEGLPAPARETPTTRGSRPLPWAAGRSPSWRSFLSRGGAGCSSPCWHRCSSPGLRRPTKNVASTIFATFPRKWEDAGPPSLGGGTMLLTDPASSLCMEAVTGMTIIT